MSIRLARISILTLSQFSQGFAKLSPTQLHEYMTLAFENIVGKGLNLRL